MAEKAIWHKSPNILPRKTIDGRWTILPGRVWRRMRPDGKWEYKQDEESFEDWFERQ